ncbi:DUF983 domain-containing protein [Sphingobacterium spiritivorum]|uniref:DUF983 domain-containing protein n=3 Tax=Sphingobacterium spiritivorum TaxID=258 RepID=D7VRS6_SPHSI|nr:DUF983 domain-containing protein [Sphingobacterium spiritivorum]EEI93445.1 hypothetical protein HMPREF0765_0873 [Sphingobacterium spiritivorum ATCC 33300]EFK56477.1 hypothetical protein HMPREF0766_13680 [Sphingobacterium spiritivorum ATCC 33861]QQS95794.1 DUF983 domain-containing protein [Sphingobacterium spiritivorum]QQT35456.1 DUF983 domain-containing protein [Sphingobacterium spiritivorum]WQD32144.1 DUF983 domain-containing protein [Sphingobacterium spiritivorum]
MKYTLSNELKSALEGKCPRCRKGDLFKAPLFSFRSKKMNETCPHCGLKFEKEPGYFYVAMYISYAFNVAELLTACFATYFLTNNLESPWLYLGVSLSAAILMAPVNYRYSRVVLLYWLTPSFRYRPDIYDVQ